MKALSETFYFEEFPKLLEGKYTFAQVEIPEIIEAQLPLGRLRTKGKINDQNFTLGIQRRKTGASFFMISKPIFKKANLSLSQKVRIQFYLVDPSLLEIPEEFNEVLLQDELANKIWETFTLGRKRSLLHYVISAKSIDTRIKRSLELAYKFKTNGLYSQQTKTNQE